MEVPGNSFDNETITVSSTAIGFTAAKITHADNGGVHPIKAIFSVETANIRILSSGNDPTTTSGVLIQANEIVEITGEADILAFKAIRDDSTDATINVEYFKD